MGISSNTYNILASLFKHIFDENEFAPRGYTLIKGAYLQWRRGARGMPWLPLLLRPVGKLSMLSENCQCCRKIVNVVESTALAPPKKKPWVPRRHCLLNNTVILRSRACTFTVGWSHCHIQNSL